MALLKFQDSIKVANFFYKTVGLQPYILQDMKEPTSLINFLIFYFLMINLNSMLVCEVIFTVVAFYNDDFVDAIMTMSYIGFVLVGDFKMLSISWKKPVLTTFMQNLQQMYPKSEQQQQEYKCTRYMQKSAHITMSFSLLYMVLIWTFNLFAIMQYLIYEYWLQVRAVGQALPYTMYCPWEWRGNWTYYMLYVLHCVAGYTSAAGQISSDLLLCATATQLIMHYDHVSRSIEEYETGQEGDKDMKFLQRSIAYHEHILRLSDEMNDIFGIPILFNFITSSFVVCFVGFQMTIGVATDTLIKLCLFLLSSLAQVYLICYFGQELINASENISMAVYRQNWHQADVRYKKMLVLIAKCAQKPAILKATFFLKISRGTMTDFMQMSYKFFALIRTMYND